MKNIRNIIFLIIIFIGLGVTKVNATNNIDIYFFYGENCPHCQKEEVFLSEVENDFDNVTVNYYETWYNEINRKLLEKVSKNFDIEISGVPVTIIGEKSYIGFNETTIKDSMLEAINDYSEKDFTNGFGNYIAGISDGGVILPNDNKNMSFNFPLIGKIELKNISLPLIAIVLGIVDGFNPCAMWILLFLISMLLGMENKKRMWILGLTFLITSAVIYMLFMVAWLNLIEVIGSYFWLKLLIALIAIVGGITNLNSYYKSRNTDGCTIVDTKKRHKIFDNIKHITHEKSFVLSITGIMILAISVNVIELACSAGLPVVFTGILKVNNLSNIEYMFYILLYIFVFLLDDIIVFSIAMATLKITGISTKYSKLTHLIGGILMIIIGLLLVLKPEWLMFNF